jgi:hypothetical protein
VCNGGFRIYAGQLIEVGLTERDTLRLCWCLGVGKDTLRFSHCCLRHHQDELDRSRLDRQRCREQYLRMSQIYVESYRNFSFAVET